MRFRADGNTVDTAAGSLQDVSLDGVVDVPSLSDTNVAGAVKGVGLGGSLKSCLGELNTLIDAKAEKLREIVAVMAQADAQLAGGPK